MDKKKLLSLVVSFAMVETGTVLESEDEIDDINAVSDTETGITIDEYKESPGWKISKRKS